MAIPFLFINWNPNPDAFVLGPFHVRYYGLLFMAAFFGGTYLFWRILKREGMPQQLTVRTLNAAFLSCIIGARLGDCFFYNAAYYISHPWNIVFPFTDGQFTGFQGLSSHGAAIGMLVGMYIFARSTRLSYVWLLDRIAMLVALGGAFVRIGNLMNSEIYGTVTSLPWGFIFLQKGETLPRHPTQIYEAIAYLLVFGVLWCIYRKRQPLPGLLLGLFLVLCFSLRFLIEYVKAPASGENELLSLLNTGQLLSLPFIFAGALLLLTVVMRSDLKSG